MYLCKHAASGFTLFNIHPTCGRKDFVFQSACANSSQMSNSHPAFEKLTSHFLTSAFKTSCNKNMSCQTPGQQSSAQSRFFLHCSCRTGSCLLGLGTNRLPFQWRTHCSCHWCQSPHRKSHHRRSFLQWLCSLRQLEEGEWQEAHRLQTPQIITVVPANFTVTSYNRCIERVLTCLIQVEPFFRTLISGYFPRLQKVPK